LLCLSAQNSFANDLAPRRDSIANGISLEVCVEFPAITAIGKGDSAWADSAQWDTPRERTR
jgi:hypothetical protein